MSPPGRQNCYVFTEGKRGKSLGLKSKALWESSGGQSLENLSWRVKLTCLSADLMLNKTTPDPSCARWKLSCWANSQGIVERCWQAALALLISPLLRSSPCRQNCSETAALGDATEFWASSRIVKGQRNSLTPGRSDFSFSDEVITKRSESNFRVPSGSAIWRRRVGYYGGPGG